MTNPHYTRSFNPIVGQIAKSASLKSEFSAVEAGFDSVGTMLANGADDAEGSSLVGYLPPGTDAVPRTVQSKLRERVSVLDFGAVVDEDSTTAFAVANFYINEFGGDLHVPGRFLVAAGTIDITHTGAGIIGDGQGNVANLTPSDSAPSEIVITGTGAGIRIRGQSARLENFRLTSDTTRAALAFDLQSPGVRVEAADTLTARADRCHMRGVRIDKQPGDAYLSVGPAIYASLTDLDIYECKGFGFRFDPGSLTGLTRTNKSYPGLSTVASCRVGYCGGHTIAASNDGVTTQAQMAVRLIVWDMDSFGNGQNTSIMYPAGDGNFYDFWIFGEQCLIEQSAPCGRVGVSLTPEMMGGIWIAGRDNRIVNCRFIDTNQPIYWGYKSAQPSTGLEVQMFRLVNATLTHDDVIKYESPLAKGLRVQYDRRDNMVNVATTYFGGEPMSQIVEYQGTHRHLSSIFTTGTNITIADDDVAVFSFDGQSTTLTYGVLTLAGSGVTAGGGIFHIRMATSAPLATKWAGEADTVAHGTGVALTGTTGADNKITVSCDATSLYIENRRGAEIALCIHLAAMPLETGIAP